MSDLHPIILAASKGRLPDWTMASEKRRAHMSRVAKLMKKWAKERGLGKPDVRRWTAAGHLHDALRGAKPSTLRPIVPDRFRKLAGPILHGPAAAVRLREEGVEDPELLTAIEYHTLGSWRLDLLGRALYIADFVEPGRTMRRRWRRQLRKRMPGDLKLVLSEILAARIAHQLHVRRPIRPETVGFWNSIARGKSWAPASEV